MVIRVIRVIRVISIITHESHISKAFRTKLTGQGSTLDPLPPKMGNAHLKEFFLRTPFLKCTNFYVITDRFCLYYVLCLTSVIPVKVFFLCNVCLVYLRLWKRRPKCKLYPSKGVFKMQE